MKILLINHEFPPVGGGAATASELLAKLLSSSGHYVEVVTSRIGFKKSEELRGAYKIKRVLGFRRSIFSGSILEVVCFLIHGIFYFSLRKKENKSDMAYAFFTMPAGLLALFLKKAYKMPYIVFLRGIDVPGFYGGRGSFLNRLLKPLIICVWNNADKVVANSDALKCLASRSFKDKEILVVPNMIDVDFFKALDNPQRQDSVKIIFAGRLNKQKNLNCLLDSIAMLIRDGEKNFIMEIIGDGQEKSSLIEKSRNLGLSEKVLFSGWSDRKGLLGRYQAGDIFISISLDEGMPNAVMEAMACGLPVVASNIPAHRELVEDGKSGLLVNPKNPAEVVGALKALIYSRSSRRALGDSGARKIRQYGLDKFSDYLNMLCIRI